MFTPLTLAQPHGRLSAGALPALLVFVIGLAVVLLRPPLPIDETRYLEIFRESLQGSPVLLRLCGEPYADKPPLLFWLGRALTWLLLPSDFAVRCVPALASALTVLFAARLGARAGLTLAGWLQAVLWFPGISSQFLAFDSLLALAVWGAIDAWVRGRDVGFTLWSAGALLAKGPVAYLFLIPLLWSTAPFRPVRAGAGKRAALALGLALIPLASWALAAAAMGGTEFANALLWERWAGRVAGSTHHARPVYFYLPIVLVGALPGTLILFRRNDRARPEWLVRLGWALVFVLVVFSLISGKQAHYLVPAAPALALLLAWRIETAPREVAWLRRGVCVQLALLACMAVLLVPLIPRFVESFGTDGRELVASGAFLVPVGLAGAAALSGLVIAMRRRFSARSLLAVALTASGTSLLPLHWLAGELLFPHALSRALQAASKDIAFLGSSHHGLYALLASTTELEKLRDETELNSWSALHPDGLLLVDPGDLDNGPPDGLMTVASDTVHCSQVLVLRARNASHGLEENAIGRP